MLSPTIQFEISIWFQWKILKEGKDCVVEHFENVLYVYVLCIGDVENSQNVPKSLKICIISICETASWRPKLKLFAFRWLNILPKQHRMPKSNKTSPIFPKILRKIWPKSCSRGAFFLSLGPISMAHGALKFTKLLYNTLFTFVTVPNLN